MRKRPHPFGHFVIENLLWNQYILVMWGGERRQRKRVLEANHAPARFLDYWLERMAAETWGANYREGRAGWLYIYFAKCPDPAHEEDRAGVAHELLHATLHRLRSVGMTLSDDSEEAFCYSNEWLHRAAWKGIREWRQQQSSENCGS